MYPKSSAPHPAKKKKDLQERSCRLRKIIKQAGYRYLATDLVEVGPHATLPILAEMVVGDLLYPREKFRQHLCSGGEREKKKHTYLIVLDGHCCCRWSVVVVVVVGLALVGGFFGDAAICWTGGGRRRGGWDCACVGGGRAGPNVTRTTAPGHGLSLTAADRRNGYCPGCSASWNTPDTGVIAVRCVCWLGVNSYVGVYISALQIYIVEHM